MTITSETIERLGLISRVTVASDLSGTVYYHWYIDGAWVGRTISTDGTSERDFALEPGERVRIAVQDSNSETYDGVANSPEGWPARRTLEWVRSLDTDIEYYLVEMQADAGGYETIAQVPAVEDQWSYRVLTPRLTDLADYDFRITPYDAVGNAGTTITARETIVRVPDAPDFTVTLETDTTVTFAEVS